MTDLVKSATFTYDEDHRYEVKEGTRCVLVKMEIPFSIPNQADPRIETTSYATRHAAHAWKEKWGDIPWDSVQILVAHVPSEVLLEFRVMK